LALAILTVGGKSKVTAATAGQITNVALDSDTITQKIKSGLTTKKKKKNSTPHTEINYNYMIDGKNYTGYIEKSGDMRSSFQIGASVNVCYNPEKPEDSDISLKCGERSFWNFKGLW
jgi:hypothetical protein